MQRSCRASFCTPKRLRFCFWDQHTKYLHPSKKARSCIDSYERSGQEGPLDGFWFGSTVEGCNAKNEIPRSWAFLPDKSASSLAGLHCAQTLTTNLKTDSNDSSGAPNGHRRPPCLQPPSRHRYRHLSSLSMRVCCPQTQRTWVDPLETLLTEVLNTYAVSEKSALDKLMNDWKPRYGGATIRSRLDLYRSQFASILMQGLLFLRHLALFDALQGTCCCTMLRIHSGVQQNFKKTTTVTNLFEMFLWFLSYSRSKDRLFNN